jgi:hypothetical protein
MEWLHPEGLVRLLHVANETYHTEYELGYVTEGFHGHYDKDGVWDVAWDYPTEVNTTLIAEDKLNHPSYLFGIIIQTPRVERTRRILWRLLIGKVSKHPQRRGTQQLQLFGDREFNSGIWVVK